MRHVVAVLGCLGLSSSACVAPPDPVVPTTALVGLNVTALPGASFCWALATRDASGADTETRGTPGAPATRDAALAAGAACGTIDAVVDPVALACAPGSASVVTWFVGAFGADGERIDDYLDPCGTDGCKTAFTCVAHAQTPVDQDFTILRDANQGFFDIGIDVADPGPVKDLCGTLRVVDGAGTVLWVDDVCASKLGNGRDAITFVGTCSSDAPANTVTLWLDDPEPAGAEPLAWTNPCARPADGSHASGDPLAWSGGCSVTATCIEDEDTYVSFDFTKAAPR